MKKYLLIKVFIYFLFFLFPKSCFSLQEYPVPNWCSFIRPLAENKLNDALSLAHLHSQIRFFGMNKRYSDADQALVYGLINQTPNDIKSLDFYKSRIADACVLGTDNHTLNPVSIYIKENIVYIKPGKGKIIVPKNTIAAVIDLRNLPNTPDLKQALENAIAAISNSPIEKPSFKVRMHAGLTDEAVYNQNVYTNSIEEQKQPPILGHFQSDLPLLLLTDLIQAPAVAEFAINLRLQRRAWLMGENVFAGVAESDSHSINKIGIAFRTKEFFFADNRWPDVLKTDFLMKNIEETAKKLSELGQPTEIRSDGGIRTKLEAVMPFGDIQPIQDSKSDLYASLVVLQSTLSLFFPYYDFMKTDIDKRYLDLIEKVDHKKNITRLFSEDTLRQFGEVLHDGHNTIRNYGKEDLDHTFRGTFPVMLDFINGKVIIRRSLVDGIAPGDSLDAIDQEPMSNWLTERLKLTSADTVNYKYYKALYEASFIYQDFLTVIASSPNGLQKKLEITPYPIETFKKLKADPSLRTDGWLTDLNAKNIYYFNIGLEKSNDAFKEHLEQAKNAKAVVLDMRGYPNYVDSYDIAQRIICKPFQTPIFKIPQWIGPTEKKIIQEPWTLEPKSNPFYCGPVVLLVGKTSMSQAENFATLLVDSHRAVVIGEQTAGTNGNITGVQLPGSFVFTFTGMDVLHADGKQFRQIGILPDIEVLETQEDFVKNRDPVLEKAIQVLN